MFICLQKKGILCSKSTKIVCRMFNCCTKNILQKSSFLSLPLQDKRKGTVNSLSSFSKLLGVSLQQQKFRAILAKPATY